MDSSAQIASLPSDSTLWVEEVEDWARLSALRQEWNALLESGPTDMPFVRHEWLSAWLAAFAPQARLRVLVARTPSGRAAGIAPFVEVRRLGLTWLVAPVNDHSCRFEWVLGPGPDAAGAVAAIWSHLRDHLRWDALLLRDLPRDGPTSTLLGAMVAADRFPSGRWESMRTPYLVLGPHPVPVEARLDAKFRANLRRRKRKLAEKGPVTLARIEREAELPAALDGFFSLEAAGWKGERGTAIARDPRLVTFYRAVALAAARGGWLSMRSLLVGGEVAATHFAFTYRDRYYLPKPAYDERLGSCSPGQLLMWEVAAESETRGLAELDFLGPDMPWKRDWAPRYRPHDWLYVYRPGLAGLALHAFKHRVKPLAREVLSWWR